jgi:cytosine/adenosine deaminase-related metal-dependent hydrolase
MRWINHRLLAVVLCFFTTDAFAAIQISVGTEPGKYVLKGTLVTPGEVIDGRVVIEGDTITCAGAACQDPPGASVISVTKAYIFPGFIDAHNHVAYNVLPRWNPPKIYTNRKQWQASSSYKQHKIPYDQNKGALSCEMIKYGEIKALMSGVTTIQGTAPSKTCVRMLIRNAENHNELGTTESHIRTYVPDLARFEGPVDWTKTKSFVVHLGEGNDEKSRAEFDTLKSKGLLTAQTAIIHGTAFGEAEFSDMAAVGAKLIWSPQSNLALYDKTTNIKIAYEKHVPISVGVDWNLSGSNSMLDELRVAAAINASDFESTIPESEWVKTVTVNPAKALALDDFIGRLAAGLKADITILKERDTDFNKSVLASRLEDVEMVWVGGELLYGNSTALNKLKPGVCEPITVHGSRKRICVADSKNPVPGSPDTLAIIQQRLQSKIPSLAPLAP